MKQQIEKYELDLIKEWKSNQKEDIALYFFEKYKDDVLNIIYSKINRKFSSIPLEKGDFFHLVWKSVLLSLSKYKIEKKSNFQNVMILYAYNASIKEALKFIRNGHIVLNNSYSYEKILEDSKNYNFGVNGQTSMTNSFEGARKKLIDEVLLLNKTYNINFLKRLIYLRSLGYSIKEISKKLKKPINYIATAINFICDIAKNLYN